MKKYKLVLASALVFCAVCFPSCVKFLEEDVRSNVPQEVYFNNEEEAVQFLYGTYGAVRNVVFGEELMVITDVMTDDMAYRVQSNYTVRAISSLRIDSKLNTFYNVWNKLYAVINNCNILLDQIPDLQEKVPFRSENVIEGEARFMRAWAFLTLVQLWGEVPLQITPTYSIKHDNLYPKRATVESIYAQIISDLDYALSAVPATSPAVVTVKSDVQYPLSVTQAAVRTLLGRVYLINKEYREVLDILQPIIDNSADGDIVQGDGTARTPFGLMSDQKDLFDTNLNLSLEAAVKVPSRAREVLWSMEASRELGVFNSWHRWVAPSSRMNYNSVEYSTEEFPTPTTGAYAAFTPTEELISTYDAVKDKRYQWQYRLFVAEPNSYPLPLKGYDRGALDNSKAGGDKIILRFADVLLMHAEAYNELDDPASALVSLNRVRVRAGLDPLRTEDLTGSKTELRELIMLERRHELAHEGYRLFDLRRTGTYYTVMQRFQEITAEIIDPGGANRGYMNVPVPQFPDTYARVSTPWAGGNKFPQPFHELHPIPFTELVVNKNLTQNPGY